MNASELSSIPIKKSTAMSLDEDILEDEEENEETDPELDNPKKERSLSCSPDAKK